ncbi:MAG: hypothetical protein AAGJ18_09450, partial [Bacteroidota bacterium]
MKKAALTFLIICTLCQLNCNKEAFTGFIHPEILPYAERFIEEGEKRGVQVDILDLEAFLANELSVEADDGICGFGWWNHRNNGRRVEILNTDGCWRARSDIEKENFVFHELGHAFLERNHFSRTFPNGSARSIMCSRRDGILCSNFAVYYDNDRLRDYYLDELFNQNTPIPDFVNRSDYIRTVFEEGTQQYLTNWELFINGDDRNINDFRFKQDTSNTGTPSTITLSTNGTGGMESFSDASIVKRFELVDFPSCSNLKAFADIKVEGLTDGYFWVGLSLREKVAPDSLQRFYINYARENENRVYNNFLHELYRLSDRTDVVSISFTLRSSTPASVTIDNLFIDL